MLDIRISNQSLRELLEGPPRITDQLAAACRTLDFTVRNVPGINALTGDVVELWYNNKRWFHGRLFRRGLTTAGVVSYVAYDPLYYLKKNPDDHYVKNATATQQVQVMADWLGIPVYKLEGTGVVFPGLHYPNSTADKVIIDMLARTAQANSKKYWYRFNPEVDTFGLHLFERIVPELMWAFQVGINLTSVRYDESAEEMINNVKLVNRETGKIVVKENTSFKAQYGRLGMFEEVDKDNAATMETDAQKYLDKLCKLDITMGVEGVNPNRVIPQMYSGDYIYVEEPVTAIIGAYVVINVTQTFVSDDLITLGMDIQKTADALEIQYADAAKT